MPKDLNLIDIQHWKGVNPQKPIIISGPFSAESEEQVLQVAAELQDLGISIFRSGI